MKTAADFVDALSAVALENTFNPYRDICPVHDAANAAELRRTNLWRCLEACLNGGADTIWVARDLGYRGGRRTGIPLTDEAHLQDASSLFAGAHLSRSTIGPPVAERTATVTWGQLNSIGKPVMLWNVFPLHPHAPGNAMTNRCHKKSERLATWPFMLALLKLLKPRKLVAIGQDAGLALADLQIDVSVVRHPSYGGQADFIAGIQDIYDLVPATPAVREPALPFAEFA
ncbi:uracil-DNA glycosylase [Paracoccus sp. 08]|uniref:uracil-DNA glycosylase n=1 Tax=Paracoccus sp. 08 TaxID=2606624 RepID=UPI002094308B|nr:uracil-DNA glycosylase [Paracoccus sp. 08]MCO6364376.1 uracil-DNA glycosylase [Paracoccus sp. 08]